MTQIYYMGFDNKLSSVLLEYIDPTGVQLTQKQIIDTVMAKLVEGENKIKQHILDGSVTLPQIIYSIKNERCLCMQEKDIGSLYLEQLLSRIVRETVPIDQLNTARQLFGLESLSPSRLKSYAKTAAKRQQSQQNSQYNGNSMVPLNRGM